MTAPCYSLDDLKQYCGGWLEADRCAAIESHVANCPDCDEKLKQIESAGGIRALFGDRATSPTQSQADAEEPQAGSQGMLWSIRHPWEPAIQSRMIGPYELLKPIGHGGMGYVYLGRHTKLERMVAIKLLPSYGRNAAIVSRFEREIKAIGQLQHPSIVTAIDAGRAGEVSYLVMEYVRGLDLSRLCKSVKNISVTDICEIGRQLAMGLAQAHAAGMVHRDIKPSNVMLDQNGTIKILDFGLVQLDRWDAAASELTTVGQFLGTLDYMAPEQAMHSGSVDYRADLYSLGATLFRLLCGRAPLASTPNLAPLEKLRALAEQRPPRIATLRPDLPSGLSQLVDQLLAFRPEDRPADAVHVAERLIPFAENSRLAKLIQPVLQSGAAENSFTQNPMPDASDCSTEQSHHAPQLIPTTATPPSPNTVPWSIAAITVISAILVVATYLTPKPQRTEPDQNQLARQVESKQPKVTEAKPKDASNESSFDGKSLDEWLAVYRQDQSPKTRATAIESINNLVGPREKRSLAKEILLREQSDLVLSKIRGWPIEDLIIDALVARAGAFTEREPLNPMAGSTSETSAVRFETTSFEWSGVKSLLQLAVQLPGFSEDDRFWKWLDEQRKGGADISVWMRELTFLSPVVDFESIYQRFPELLENCDSLFLATPTFQYGARQRIAVDGPKFDWLQRFQVSVALRWLDDPSKEFAQKLMATRVLQEHYLRTKFSDTDSAKVAASENLLGETFTPNRFQIWTTTLPNGSMKSSYRPDGYPFFRGSNDDVAPFLIGTELIVAFRREGQTKYLYDLEKAVRENALKATEMLPQLLGVKDIESLEFDSSTYLPRAVFGTPLASKIPLDPSDAHYQWCVDYCLHKQIAKTMLTKWTAQSYHSYTKISDDRFVRLRPQIVCEWIDLISQIDADRNLLLDHNEDSAIPVRYLVRIDEFDAWYRSLITRDRYRDVFVQFLRDHKEAVENKLPTSSLINRTHMEKANWSDFDAFFEREGKGFGLAIFNAANSDKDKDGYLDLDELTELFYELQVSLKKPGDESK